MSIAIAGTARSALVVLAVVALLTAAGCREGKEAAAPAAEPATTETQPSTQPPRETVAAPEPAEGNVLATVRAGETPPVAVCPQGSTPDRPGPAEQARPRGMTSMAFDRQSGRIVTVSTRAGRVRTWTFDVCTNTWQPMAPARELRSGGGLVYDADSDLTILFPDDYPIFPWAYSVETNTWTEQPLAASAPGAFDLGADDLAYDPVSGLVVIRDEHSRKLWAYDVETNTWTEVDQGDVPPPKPALGAHFHSLLAYDGSADKLVLYLDEQGFPHGTYTWTFDPRTGTWAEQQVETPRLNTGFFESGGEIAFDEATGRTVVFSDGVLAAYDAGEWEVLQGDPQAADPGAGPLNRFTHALVYDPVNERIVLYGGQARMPEGWRIRWRNLRDVWAFDPRTGAWTELVPRR